MNELNKYLELDIVGVIGGKRLDNSIVKESQIIVGTPGRIYDLLKKYNRNK